MICPEGRREAERVQIGKELVFSNAAEIFALRTKESIKLPVAVDLEDSLALGSWMVLSCTSTIVLRQQ